MHCSFTWLKWLRYYKILEKVTFFSCFLLIYLAMSYFTNDQRAKSLFGVDWLLIFYHNSSRGDFFQSHEDALFINTEDKFSILQYIDHSFAINGKYEYLLEYPELNRYIHWTQKVNAIDNVSNVAYNEISSNCQSFYGLSRSYNYQQTLLDGTPGDQGSFSWWYSIGSRVKFDSQNIIPGPTINSISTTVKEVSLWIRSPIKTLILRSNDFKCPFTNPYDGIFIFILSLWFSGI